MQSHPWIFLSICTYLHTYTFFFSDFKLHRYRLGICEGSQEIPFAKVTPLEHNVEFMHGVSFHKGCYLGQELTARTHHTGVIRKRIMPLEFSQEFSSEKDIGSYMAFQTFPLNYSYETSIINIYLIKALWKWSHFQREIPIFKMLPASWTLDIYWEGL